MAEPVFRVPIVLVVDAPRAAGLARRPIAQKERVSLGGNRQAPKLPLPAGLRVVVVLLDFEYRAGDRAAIVGIERSKRCAIAATCAHDSARIARLPSLAIRATRTFDQTAALCRYDRHGVGIFHRVRAA